MPITDAASEAGYGAMVPDTPATMASAQRMCSGCAADVQRMCEKAGFRDIPAYTSSPLVGIRFTRLELDRSGVHAAVESRISFLCPKTNTWRL